MLMLSRVYWPTGIVPNVKDPVLCSLCCALSWRPLPWLSVFVNLQDVWRMLPTLRSHHACKPLKCAEQQLAESVSATAESEGAPAAGPAAGSAAASTG